MSWPADSLAGFYLFLFAFGLIFSAVSLLFGAGHESFGHHGGGADALAAHGDVQHAGTGPAHHGGGFGDGLPSPLNLSTVLIFLTWFGAAGYIVRVSLGGAAGVTLLAGALLGLVGASLVYLFLARFLWRGQTALDPANYTLTDTVARVSSPIRPGGTGEIVYTIDGKRRVDGARAGTPTTIPRGAEVVIERYEGGLAYVAPLSAWLERSGDRSGEPFLGTPREPERTGMDREA